MADDSKGLVEAARRAEKQPPAVWSLQTDKPSMPSPDLGDGLKEYDEESTYDLYDEVVLGPQIPEDEKAAERVVILFCEEHWTLTGRDPQFATDPMGRKWCVETGIWGIESEAWLQDGQGE